MPRNFERHRLPPKKYRPKWKDSLFFYFGPKSTIFNFCSLCGDYCTPLSIFPAMKGEEDSVWEWVVFVAKMSFAVSCSLSSSLLLMYIYSGLDQSEVNLAYCSFNLTNVSSACFTLNQLKSTLRTNYPCVGCSPSQSYRPSSSLTTFSTSNAPTFPSAALRPH